MRLERQPFVARSPRNYNRPADALFSPPGGKGKPWLGSHPLPLGLRAILHG